MAAYREQREEDKKTLDPFKAHKVISFFYFISLSFFSHTDFYFFFFLSKEKKYFFLCFVWAFVF